MKKILLVFDGVHFSKGALEFARQLNEKNPVLLTAAFIPQADFVNSWNYSGSGMAGPDLIPLLEPKETDAVKENIRHFEMYCQKNGIEYRVHNTYFDFTLPELKSETRFADLLIIGSQVFYEQAGIDNPNEYLQQMLHSIECPVIVVPEKFNFPASTILSYDGSESSVYAIKQFANLLPELTGNETVLVYAKEKNDDLLPDEVNIEELAARHFPDLALLRLDASPKKYFATWLEEKKSAILVSGAFGRSGISRSFRKSFTTDIISDHRLPVFIAHK